MIIDWNEVWKKQMNRQRRSNFGRPCGEYWKDDESARKYWLGKFTNRAEQVEKSLAELPITPESRILDIGSGPGVLAIPLAERVAHVTAVEPSQGMMNVMCDLRSEMKVTNLKCVQKTWDEIDIESDLDPPYDLVLASKSLGMFDIKDAIRKMEAASSKHIHIYWFAGQPTWDLMYQTLWPQIHQTEYQAGPKCDVLFNVLYQMGIYPQIRSYPSEFRERFSSLNEAVDYFVPKINLKNEWQKPILEKFLDQELVYHDNHLILQYKTNTMHIWWEKA